MRIILVCLFSAILQISFGENKVLEGKTTSDWLGSIPAELFQDGRMAEPSFLDWLGHMG